MALITLRNIQIAFGGPLILDDLSLDVHKGQRIGLLGRNGAGKSTLLKIISGEFTVDSGDIIFAPGLKISCLPQDVPDNIPGTVFETVLSGGGKTGEVVADYYRHQKVSGNSDKLHYLQHTITELDGWSIENSARRVLDQVDIPPDLLFNDLSGGMKRRVFLARALVSEPDVLLLDEPTNHLDLLSITWLENFLINSRLTVLFVTHDRRLLRKLATRIVEIDRGKTVDWSCDYTTFLERKQAVLDIEEKEWERFDKKLAKEEIWIRQGIKARRTRNEGRVRALEKMRIERRKRRERQGSTSMSISLSSRSGERVLETNGLTFGYGKTAIVSEFSFSLTRGDRIGIIGANGCGKTTLLNLLLGKLTPQHGSVEFGTNVSPVYFDQLRQGLDHEKSVMENVAPHGEDMVCVNGVHRHVMGYLQDFLFTSDRAKSPVKHLSGGERHRLLLAKLFTNPANLLVFDEPTNDLDAETLELLEEVLLDYPGTLIVVSHDREFLNNVVTSVLAFSPSGEIREFIGGYDDWERQQTDNLEIKAEKKELPGSKAVNIENKQDIPRKLTFNEKRELKNLPELIESLESEQSLLQSQLSDFVQCQKPGFVNTSQTRLKTIENELAAAYDRWDNLERIDSLSAVKKENS